MAIFGCINVLRQNTGVNWQSCETSSAFSESCQVLELKRSRGLLLALDRGNAASSGVEPLLTDNAIAVPHTGRFAPLQCPIPASGQLLIRVQDPVGRARWGFQQGRADVRVGWIPALANRVSTVRYPIPQRTFKYVPTVHSVTDETCTRGDVYLSFPSFCTRPPIGRRSSRRLSGRLR